MCIGSAEPLTYCVTPQAYYLTYICFCTIKAMNYYFPCQYSNRCTHNSGEKEHDIEDNSIIIEHFGLTEFYMLNCSSEINGNSHCLISAGLCPSYVKNEISVKQEVITHLCSYPPGNASCISNVYYNPLKDIQPFGTWYQKH